MPQNQFFIISLWKYMLFDLDRNISMCCFIDMFSVEYRKMKLQG